MKNKKSILSRQTGNIHFVGIGGIGMSAIAEVLLLEGYSVSGSDVQSSETTLRLQELGAKIYIGHSEENLKDSQVLVHSSAIAQENVEVAKAKERNICILRRAEILSDIMKLKYGIAIAGSHGKTTTSGMVASILESAGLSPTFIIGGIINNLGLHAKVGNGEWLVAEADESDGTFLQYSPIFSVITNVDDDHLDFYKKKSNLVDSFIEFANRVPFYGSLIFNYDDKTILENLNRIKKPRLSYSITSNLADIFIENLEMDHAGSKFDVIYKGTKIGRFTLNVPGKHNVSNSLAAIGVSILLEVEPKSIIKGLNTFKGMGRRLETIYSRPNGATIIEDYGHHPTEISTVIDALAFGRKGKKLTVIFEPHRYSRTRDCWQQFLHAFNSADEVYFLPIYSAGEDELSGISSQVLMSDINKIHPGLVKYIESYEKLEELFKKDLFHKNNIVLALGAGKIGKITREIIKKNGK